MAIICGDILLRHVSQATLIVISCVLCGVYTSQWPEVMTKYGAIRGKTVLLPTNKTVDLYLGIPYAKAKRFRNSENPEPWNSPLEAHTYGKVCPQPVIPFYYNITMNDMSEDCLFLNIFAPTRQGMNLSAQPALPVMVWIHGGGLTVGSGSQRGLGVFTSEGGVIVVSFNYRIGVLGFAAVSGDGELKGNYGMLDQLQALKWVHENIRRFGGDPRKVTIFGYSSGGINVGYLTMTPLAKGLFNGAILQSGVPRMATWSTYEKAREVARELIYYTGCSNLDSLAFCLRKMTIKEIITVQLKLKSMFKRVLDGYFLPDEPEKLMMEGRYHRVTFMAGIAREDGDTLLTPFPGFSDGVADIDNGVSRETFIHYINQARVWNSNQTTQYKEAILYEYTDWRTPRDPNTTRAQLVDLVTDYAFRAPLVKTADLLAKANSSIYLYQMEYEPGDWVPWHGAYHGSDYAYMFGKPLLKYHGNFNNTEVVFSHKYMELWSNFAKTGNPNGISTSPVWPLYTVTTQQYLALKPNLEVKSKLRPDKMVFWNSFLPKLLGKRTTVDDSAAEQQPCNNTDKKLLNGLFAGVVILGLTTLVLLMSLVYLFNRRRSQALENLEYGMISQPKDTSPL